MPIEIEPEVKKRLNQTQVFIIVPEEVELLHETLLLPLQSLRYSVHFPKMKQKSKHNILRDS